MNWDAFLMGISDFGLERLKEERQKKTQKELMELQQKYAQESARFAQNLKDESDAKRATGVRETADGMRVNVNPFGEEIGTPFEVGAYEKEERQMKKEDHQSNIAYRQGSLANQSKQLDLQRQRLEEARAARQTEAPQLPDSDEAAMERIFAPLIATAKTPAEDAAMWDIARRVYTDRMRKGVYEDAPSDAELRGMARDIILKEIPTGRYGSLWRFDKFEEE